MWTGCFIYTLYKLYHTTQNNRYVLLGYIFYIEPNWCKPGCSVFFKKNLVSSVFCKRNFRSNVLQSSYIPFCHVVCHILCVQARALEVFFFVALWLNVHSHKEVRNRMFINIHISERIFWQRINTSELQPQKTRYLFEIKTKTWSNLHVDMKTEWYFKTLKSLILLWQIHRRI